MRIFTPLGMMMVVPHHVAYLIGQGFSKPVAALAFGSLGIFSFTGRIVFGLLSDRLGQITTIILTYSLSIIGTLLEAIRKPFSHCCSQIKQPPCGNETQGDCRGRACSA